MQALLSGMQPEQYVTMLTAENAKEVLALMDVGQDPGLLDAKAIMAAIFMLLKLFLNINCLTRIFGGFTAPSCRIITAYFLRSLGCI